MRHSGGTLLDAARSAHPCPSYRMAYGAAAAAGNESGACRAVAALFLLLLLSFLFEGKEKKKGGRVQLHNALTCGHSLRS